MTQPGLDEGRRQAYLAALGIPLWSVQQPLPGAAPAQPLDFQSWLSEDCSEPAEVPYESAPLQVEPVAPRPLVPASPPVVAEKAPPAMMPRSPLAAARSALQASADFPRFSFFLRSYEGWQLIISLGEAPDLSRREHALLAQIEAVLGVTGGGSQTHFRWPLNNNPAIARDAQAAAEAVSAFMRRAHRAGHRYLLLGDALAPFLGQALAAVPLAQSPSLAELLAQPLRKRELWHALAPTLS